LISEFGSVSGFDAESAFPRRVQSRSESRRIFEVWLGRTLVLKHGDKRDNSRQRREEGSTWSHHSSCRDQRYLPCHSEQTNLVEIVEKTATYVSRNNKDFEERIRENERANPKFAFLNPIDPFYRYYDWRLKELQAGGSKAATPFATRIFTPQAIKKDSGLPEPPPFQFSGKLPPITAQDLDILRLTALFVARHGNAFQRSIADRESRNYQFDFLRANHSLYPYFQQMVSEYNRVLLPPKGMLDQIRRMAEDKEAVLDDVHVRVVWQKYIIEQANKDKQEQERERGTHSLSR
jgi:Surp module